MSENDKKSKTMCLAPFTTLFMGATGENRLCCVSLNPIIEETYTRGGVEYTRNKITKIFPKDIQEDVWTTDYYKDVRRRMLAGEKIEECQHCYDIEESGGISDRQYNNRIISKLHGNEFTINVETGNNKHMPIDLDIRPSNLCNLKCRMCFSDSSSLIGKEISENPALVEIVPDIKDCGLVDWFSDPVMQEQLKIIIPHVKRLKLLGGETSIIDKVHELLEWCIEHGHTDIMLDITTNVTNTNDKFFNLIKQFKHVSICISIDGIGEVNDYIRFPSKWHIIERNIKRYLEDDIPEGNEFFINIISTSSIYSILYIKDLIRWVYGLPNPHNRLDDERFLLCPVHHPIHQQVNLIPLDKRDEIVEQLLDVAKELNISDYIMGRSRLSVVINELSSRSVATPEMYDRFIKSTHMYDLIRDQDVKTSLPELYNLFKEDFDL